MTVQAQTALLILVAQLAAQVDNLERRVDAVEHTLDEVLHEHYPDHLGVR